MNSLSDGNLYFAVHYQRVLKLDTQFQVKFNTSIQCFLPTRHVGKAYGKTKTQLQLLRHVKSFCGGAKNLFSTVSKENRHKTGIK